jgi:Tol biopolymer transport system component
MKGRRALVLVAVSVVVALLVSPPALTRSRLLARNGLIAVVRSKPNGGDYLQLIRADGSSARVISTPGASWVCGPKWSPDGTLLAFLGGPASGGGYAGRGTVWVVRADGRQVGHLPVPTTEMDTQPDLDSIQWSPDSRRLAFSTESHETFTTFRTDVRVVAVPAFAQHILRLRGAPRGLRTDQLSIFGWSQRGQLGLADGSSIFVADPTGASFKRLTAGQDPQFSPDGREIAFTRGEFVGWVGNVLL